MRAGTLNHEHARTSLLLLFHLLSVSSSPRELQATG